MYVLNVHNWYCVIEIIVSFSCFYKYFWLLHSMVLKDLIPCGTGPRPRWANQSPSYPELFELKLRKKENFSSVEAINVKHRSCQQSCILPCGSSWSAKKENEADMQKAVEIVWMFGEWTIKLLDLWKNLCVRKPINFRESNQGRTLIQWTTRKGIGSLINGTKCEVQKTP